ncbi:MAG: hypothetical protein KC646_00930 [Candidatus Cloacimonetes bacterium]|nr:hypothetical protein [Candidatus Cloacimonadota bacterium]
MINYYKSIIPISLCCLLISLYLWGINTGMSSLELSQAQNYWNNSQCMECHQDKTSLNNFNKKEHPKFHSDLFVEYTHGKLETNSPQKCLNCHKAQSCKDCHSTAPKNHTQLFKSPQLNHFASNQHILLGRMNKQSCLSCHQNYVAQCSNCHEIKELQQWRKQFESTKNTWSYLFEN